MFIVRDLNLAILLCVITMLGWGSWANSQKLAGREKWPFQLFYWDYSIGVLLFGLLFALTVGSFGSVGTGAIANLRSAKEASIGQALFSGGLFNLSNILLVVAIDAAGMTVAFPVGVGLALVIGTVVSYLQTPKGNPALLATGVALVVLAMILSALAHRTLPGKVERGGWRGLAFAIVAGSLMGLFYPQLMGSILRDFNTSPIERGYVDTLRGAPVFRGRGVLEQFSDQHDFHAGLQTPFCRLRARICPAARNRHPWRDHLDAGSFPECDRIRGRRPCGFV